MYKLQKNIHRKPIQKLEKKNEKLNQCRKNNEKTHVDRTNESGRNGR